ncbi:MAG: DUF4199 domain-containing protein [Bacteroidales bacterium]|nr:DUF4199 domain-containing protein [Bacteroidales bacterium]
MENKEISSGKITLNYGLIISVLVILLTLLLYVFDLSLNKYLDSLNYIILLLGIIWGIKTYRDKYLNGYITYGKSFSTGFIIGLYASIIFGIFSFIFYKFLGADIILQILERSEEAAIERMPDISDEQLEITMSFTKKFTSPVMLAVSNFVLFTFFSAIFSLFVSIFIKKEDNSIDNNIQ